MLLLSEEKGNDLEEESCLPNLMGIAECQVRWGINSGSALCYTAAIMSMNVLAMTDCDQR